MKAPARWERPSRPGTTGAPVCPGSHGCPHWGWILVAGDWLGGHCRSLPRAGARARGWPQEGMGVGGFREATSSDLAGRAGRIDTDWLFALFPPGSAALTPCASLNEEQNSAHKAEVGPCAPDCQSESSRIKMPAPEPLSRPTKSEFLGVLLLFSFLRTVSAPPSLDSFLLTPQLRPASSVRTSDPRPQYASVPPTLSPSGTRLQLTYPLSDPRWTLEVYLLNEKRE